MHTSLRVGGADPVTPVTQPFQQNSVFEMVRCAHGRVQLAAVWHVRTMPLPLPRLSTLDERADVIQSAAPDVVVPPTIGLVGLAVMGQNLALNIASKGFKIAVHNRSPEKA